MQRALLARGPRNVERITMNDEDDATSHLYGHHVSVIVTSAP